LGAAVAFLLAVPIVNPVVWLTTFIAFRNNVVPACIRCGSGYVIAVIVGFVFQRLHREPHRALNPEIGGAVTGSCSHTDGANEECSTCGHHDHVHEPEDDPVPLKRKLWRVFQHSMSDFYDVIKYLILGAFIAACLRTAIGTSGIGRFSSTLLSIPSSMATAFILNLCSEADAFIGASFQGLLPLASILSFLILGPMLDIKLLSAYKLLFTKKAAIKLAMLITVAVGIWSLLLFLVTGGAGV
jgi:hypothetical protein